MLKYFSSWAQISYKYTRYATQINGPHNAPFSQKLDLGWVVVGHVCLRGAHRLSLVATYKTSILESGCPSYLSPCISQVKVKERFSDSPEHLYTLEPNFVDTIPVTLDGEHLGQSIFLRSAKDHKLAPSIDHDRFHQIMDKEFRQDNSNSWVAPLPFQEPRQRLPNNRDSEYKRLMSLRHTINK